MKNWVKWAIGVIIIIVVLIIIGYYICAVVY
jgi:hypothetical protein